MSLRNLPSVEQLIQHPEIEKLIHENGRPLVLSAIRDILDEVRSRFTANGLSGVPSTEALLPQIVTRLHAWTNSSLQTVINATGVILHTNLGRAPLSKSATSAMNGVSSAYSNLELDLGDGKRGARMSHVEEIFKKLTGAEAVLVVNNNAAAVLLVLSVFANKRRVIIPRSQLVEIGGGFRVPDVMKQSGAKLIEIGTTNKVHLDDYREALDVSAYPLQKSVPVVMRAHRSNFKMVGFTEEPELQDVIGLAHEMNALFVDDLGSGALIDTQKYGMAHEPTVQESLAAGADLVCFSGDKLLGGPQCGIILGSEVHIAKLKKHPLARALRADKMTLAALSATLIHYLKDEVEKEIPIWQMISASLDSIQQRAENWQKQLGFGEVIKTESTVGGGSLPGEVLLSFALALTVKSPEKFLAKLRRQNPPVIARIENDKILFDPRTMFAEQEILLISSLQSLVSNY